MLYGDIYDSVITWHDKIKTVPDSKVHGTNMGPIWGRQDPGGPHVSPMNFAIWGFVVGWVCLDKDINDWIAFECDLTTTYIDYKISKSVSQNHVKFDHTYNIINYCI